MEEQKQELDNLMRAVVHKAWAIDDELWQSGQSTWALDYINGRMADIIHEEQPL